MIGNLYFWLHLWLHIHRILNKWNAFVWKFHGIFHFILFIFVVLVCLYLDLSTRYKIKSLIMPVYYIIFCVVALNVWQHIFLNRLNSEWLRCGFIIIDWMNFIENWMQIDEIHPIENHHPSLINPKIYKLFFFHLPHLYLPHTHTHAIHWNFNRMY